MDPHVRRRRIVLGSGLLAAVSGLTAGYLVLADWPRWSLRAWDRAQSFLGFLPELPGM
ncbi:hypothetical protein ACVW00_002201 [Marmoricola sp. URHA0025 HA25]